MSRWRVCYVRDLKSKKCWKDVHQNIELPWCHTLAIARKGRLVIVYQRRTTQYDKPSSSCVIFFEPRKASGGLQTEWTLGLGDFWFDAKTLLTPYLTLGSIGKGALSAGRVHATQKSKSPSNNMHISRYNLYTSHYMDFLAVSPQCEPVNFSFLTTQSISTEQYRSLQHSSQFDRVNTSDLFRVRPAIHTN